MNVEELKDANEKKQPKPLTEEHLQEIRRQPRVTKGQFIEELFTLVEDTFEGMVRDEDGGISVQLPAGERFMITIAEN